MVVLNMDTVFTGLYLNSTRYTNANRLIELIENFIYF